MTTQTQLRQMFTRDLPCLTDLGQDAWQDAWLIKGDFDRFKLFNDLYGYLLTDYILDWSIEAIESELISQEKRLGIGPILWNVIGDDVTIYIPPSGLRAGDVADLLHALRRAVQASFDHRYAINALSFSPDLINFPVARLEDLKNDLEQSDIILDFAPRCRGHLALFPVALSSELPALIQRHLGQCSPLVMAKSAWLYDPARQTCHTANAGFIFPPSISFSAVSIRQVMAVLPVTELHFEHLTIACQSALKVCKQRRCGIWLPTDVIKPAEVSVSTDTISASDACSQLHWASERCLRERLYFRPLEQPMLFQINPVYRITSGPHAGYPPADNYRGNAYGMGLKGINELCGANVADGIIRRLIAAFAETFQEISAAQGIPLASFQPSLFVDRFTVFSQHPGFSLVEIVALGKRMMDVFNIGSKGVRGAHLRLSVAAGQQPLPGYMLFYRLAVTQHAAGNPVIAFADDALEVRQYCPAAARDGSLKLESIALSSAQHLADFHSECTFSVRAMTASRPISLAGFSPLQVTGFS